MLQEKSETEDKAQGVALDSSADTQEKWVEFSESPKKPDELDEDSSDLDKDKHEATRSVRVKMPPIRYDLKDDHVLFAVVTETETSDPSGYMEAIKADDHGKWITAIEQDIEFWIKIKHENW